MKTTWQNSWTPAKEYPALVGNIVADVVIIGGGITGITAAYFLAKAGKNAVVLEKGTLGENSTTAYTTAFLAYEIDTSLPDLVKMFGKKNAMLVWQSGKDAIDMVETIIKEEGIQADFMRVPEFIFAATKKEWKEVEAEALAGQNGGFQIDIHKDGNELPFKHSGYSTFGNTAKFHPLKYADGLRQAAERHGATFYENSEAVSFEGEDKVEVKTKDGSVVAKYVIIATYNPFNKPRELFGKKGMYVSYICELSIPRGMYPEALYIDSQNPYHYFRVDRGEKEDRMIFGGEDHREEIQMDTEKNWTALLSHAEDLLGIVPYSVTTKWNGPILESWDGLPFIGLYDKKHLNRLVATAFSGNGMTYGTIAGKLLTDIISGKKNIYENIYYPRRGYSFTALIIKGRDYIMEFIGGVLRNLFQGKKKVK